MAKPANILYLLWWHLNQYHWFKIPGIACFKAEAQASHVNHLEGQIYPGHLKIALAPLEDTDPHEMLEHLESDFGYKKEDLLAHLNALQIAASGQLEAQGHFNLVPFGELNMDKDVLVFKQSTLNIHREFYGTTPLPVKPVQKLYQPQPFISRPPVYLEERKKKKPINPLFIILGFLWIIFLALVFWPEKKPSEVNALKTPEDSSMLLTAEDSALLKSIQIHKDDSMLQPEEQNAQVILDPDSQETKITAPLMDSLNQVVRHKACIIIVGSFLNKSNAERLAQKIEKQNYKVYKGVYGKFNRVGIEFNCMEKDLEQVLKELKQHFNPTAWVLKMDK